MRNSRGRATWRSIWTAIWWTGAFSPPSTSSFPARARRPQFGLDFLQLFLFIALLEELFFRGFLQTLLTQTLRSEYGAQALAACLFGVFHILHAPFPNWRYVALATLAGWFYGSAFRQGGGLLASALTHAAVDTLWRAFFTRG